MQIVRRIFHSEHPATQVIRFMAVGGIGLVVNLLVIVLCNKLGPDSHGVAIDLPNAVEYNVRWYHVFAVIAFFAANASNFWFNRTYTFRTTAHAHWFSEYWPALLTGLIGLALNLGVLTLLLHPGSFLSLSPDFFDDSSGLRTRLYWAQFIALVVVTPLSFVVNKYWAFGAVLRKPDHVITPIGDLPSEE
ncbi:putative flippase GtrA [Marmoricola sp. OAE513]|uniref:GtrA family protein n=1 Tax=Marmoricola sp. OAE513 TaxID=2817894 RepID=UPI001DE9A665